MPNDRFPIKRDRRGVEYFGPRYRGTVPIGWATCGHCGRSWNDRKSTAVTPAPSGRCPFEYEHTYGKRSRRNPRQIDADEDIRIDVFMEDDRTGAWVKEATCTLAEFFAENTTVTRKEVRPLLFMRGQYVDGGGASARWKIAFAK